MRDRRRRCKFIKANYFTHGLKRNGLGVIKGYSLYPFCCTMQLVRELKRAPNTFVETHPRHILPFLKAIMDSNNFIN